MPWQVGAYQVSRFSTTNTKATAMAFKRFFHVSDAPSICAPVCMHDCVLLYMTNANARPTVTMSWYSSVFGICKIAAGVVLRSSGTTPRHFCTGVGVAIVLLSFVCVVTVGLVVAVCSGCLMVVSLVLFDGGAPAMTVPMVAPEFNKDSTLVGDI